MTLRSNISALRSGLRAATSRGAQLAAKEGLRLRDQRVPMDTGDLKRSGVVRQTAEMTWEFAEGDGLPDQRALFTEFGTIHMPAQPHMTPAAMALRPDQFIGSEILNVIKRSANL